jgi:hypothetical protein
MFLSIDNGVHSKAFLLVATSKVFVHENHHTGREILLDLTESPPSGIVDRRMRSCTTEEEKIELGNNIVDEQ